MSREQAIPKRGEQGNTRVGLPNPVGFPGCVPPQRSGSGRRVQDCPATGDQTGVEVALLSPSLGSEARIDHVPSRGSHTVLVTVPMPTPSDLRLPLDTVGGSEESFGGRTALRGCTVRFTFPRKSCLHTASWPR